jgi:hypothetical protein
MHQLAPDLLDPSRSLIAVAFSAASQVWREFSAEEASMSRFIEVAKQSQNPEGGTIGVEI